MPFKNLDEVRAYIASNHPELLVVSSKYAPKLAFTDRCEILALSLLPDFDRRAAAAGYGIARSTVNYITTATSPHYKEVRKELAERGREDFISTYLTEGALEKYAIGKKQYEATLSDNAMREASNEGHLANKGANKRADKAAGPFRYRDVMETASASVEWSDDPGPDPIDQTTERSAGWYVRHMGDNKLYGDALHSKTSTAAKLAFLRMTEGTEVP